MEGGSAQPTSRKSLSRQMSMSIRGLAGGWALVNDDGKEHMASLDWGLMRAVDGRVEANQAQGNETPFFARGNIMLGGNLSLLAMPIR
eukprot:5817051-Prymnesium_polylepis.1